MCRPVPTVTALVLAALVGCEHPSLDFELPDAGAVAAGSGRGAGPGGRGPDDDRSTAVSATHSTATGAEPFDEGVYGGTLVSDGGATSAAVAAPFDVDPIGHPASPEQRPAECDTGQMQPELCGTEIDEDCDGTVDEHAGIGRPCRPTDARDGCDENGATVCVAGTRALVCVPYGCVNTTADPLCGNGFVEGDEACDPGAVGETAETCTEECLRPLFQRCLFQEGEAAEDFPCERGRVCSEWVGACVFEAGGPTLRCPEIAVQKRPGAPPDTRDFYPMVETEDGQCWISCSDDAQCPAGLPDCYMGFCVVDL